MTASLLASAPFASLGRRLFQRSQAQFSLVDQALVSGLGFLTGVGAARLLGLEEFGRFAVVMILSAVAQGVHNALVIAPMMSLAGTPRGRSPAHFTAALVATLIVSIPLALAVMALLAGFEWAEGKPLWFSLIGAAGALALGQNLLLTVRRILFARRRGGEGLAVDIARAGLLVVIVALVWASHATVHVDLVVWLLALASAVPAIAAMMPMLGARGRRNGRAFLKRCWPMARWMLPSVVATFAQEQLVWLLVGFWLGDAPVGGLRAAQYLVSLAYPFLAALENIVPVEASRAYVAGGADALRRYIARTTLLYSPLACGFPLVAAISASFWLRLFFGDKFQGFATCLQVFALVVLFVFLRDMLGYFFRATQRTKVIFQAFVLSSVATLLAIYPLIHAFGVLGAAAGIATGNGLSMAYLLVAAWRTDATRDGEAAATAVGGGATEETTPCDPAALRIGVVIATAGRPADVARLLSALGGQTRRPDAIVISVPRAGDAPITSDTRVHTVIGARGLPAQRNAGLAALPPCDIVAFFDDDFLPAADYLARIAAAMAADPSVLAADGQVVLDGAVGPGLDWDTAARILAGSAGRQEATRYDQPDGLYGCNMCYRTAGLGTSPFDENLPLYAWLEDYDLSRRVAQRGRIARVMSARGVHLGVKRGRTSGLRMGYSQIANPVYLLRKGTMPLGVCARHLVRRPLGNAWGALRRDPTIDRAGRLRGNLIGLMDAARGRLAIDRVLQL